MAAARSSTQDSAERARFGRRARTIAVAALLVALLVAVIVRGRDRFEGRVFSEEGKAAHVLYQGEPFTLRFTDRRESGTAYQVLYSQDQMVRFFQGQTGAKGHASRIRVTQPGPRSRVSVRWLVEGKVRARWAFVLRGPRKSAARQTAADRPRA